MKTITSLLVIVLLLPTTISAQVVFSPTEEQKVGLMISGIQHGLQRARVGNVELPLGLTFFVDGLSTDSAGVAATVNTVLTALPSRGVAFTNPLPAKLGPFWDFQITERSLQFDGDSCHVTCGYLLLANGVRRSSGRIDLVKFGGGYRIVRLDGLLPLLNQEVSAAKSVKVWQREVK